MIRTPTLALLAFFTVAAVPGAASAHHKWIVFALDGKGKLCVGQGGGEHRAVSARHNPQLRPSGRVVVETRGNCAAHSENKNGGYWFYNAVAGSAHQASALALHFCTRNGIPGCRLVATACHR